LAVVALGACGRFWARSNRSFDEIRDLVSGKTAAQVASLLGEPDARQNILSDEQRWVWWNYTFLDGEQYPPETRGRIVHLEITLTKQPMPAGITDAVWRVSSPFGVTYSWPGKT
jgi:hypothetical protein